MTKKAINIRFVVWTTLATAFGIVFSIGAVYLTVKYLVLNDQPEAVAAGRRSAELPNPNGQLWRVHVLLR